MNAQLAFDYEVPPIAPVTLGLVDELYEPVVCKTEEGDGIAREILKLIERNEYHFNSTWTRGGYGGVFDVATELIDYALHCQEDDYMTLIRKMKPEAVKVCTQIYAHLSRMWSDYVVADILGMVYMEVASLSKCQWMGQYFTPMALCDAIARITLGDIHEAIATAKAERRRITICDPAVGSGAMLLAAKKIVMEAAGLRGLDHFQFFGQDKDPLCVRMTRIQMTLTNYRYMADRMIVAAYDAHKQQEAHV